MNKPAVGKQIDPIKIKTKLFFVLITAHFPRLVLASAGT